MSATELQANSPALGTYFQKVGLKAMAAAETVSGRSASSDLAIWPVLTPMQRTEEALLAEVDELERLAQRCGERHGD
jgi:hypothetical protein